MIVLPPYLPDRELYFLLPEEDRWIFNKMEICRRFGYGPYGPCGIDPPPGLYCVRPIINMAGMAEGGYWKCLVTEVNKLPKEANLPGYFWTPWETGTRVVVEYVGNNISSSSIVIKFDEKTGMEHYRELPMKQSPALPEPLRGISRYMRVEYLGDIVIDLGPRHILEEARNSIVQDYRNYDPSYEPQSSVTFGFQPFMKRVPVKGTKAYKWEEVTTSVSRKLYA